MEAGLAVPVYDPVPVPVHEVKVAPDDGVAVTEKDEPAPNHPAGGDTLPEPETVMPR